MFTQSGIQRATTKGPAASAPTKMVVPDSRSQTPRSKTMHTWTGERPWKCFACGGNHVGLAHLKTSEHKEKMRALLDNSREVPAASAPTQNVHAWTCVACGGDYVGCAHLGTSEHKGKMSALYNSALTTRACEAPTSKCTLEPDPKLRKVDYDSPPRLLKRLRAVPWRLGCLGLVVAMTVVMRSMSL